MNPPKQQQEDNHQSENTRPVIHHFHHLPPLQIRPSSPRYPLTTPATSILTPTSAAHRRIAIAVDLSDESAFAVKWAVQNYLRPGDAVILLHVNSTSVLYGADWGSTTTPDHSASQDAKTAFFTSPSPQTDHDDQNLDEEFDNFTTTKAAHLAQPLVDARVPFKIHIVKDHDMKERLCLEVERLGLSAVIMGSRGFGASRKGSKGRLGSVSDYCVHHCVCPVVVVRYPEGKDAAPSVMKRVASDIDLHPVPEEEEQEFHDADDKQKVS